MAAKRAEPMMVLSMDVVRDRAPNGDEAGPRRHWQEPPPATCLRFAHNFQNIGEANASLALKHAGFVVECYKPVKRSAVDQAAARIQRHVAIGPSASIRKGSHRAFSEYPQCSVTIFRSGHHVL